MPLFPSNPLLDVSVLSWKTLRYGLPSYTFGSQCLQPLQGTEVDRQAIELLAPRVRVLSESLCAPIHPGDVNEKTRGEKLEQ